MSKIFPNTAKSTEVMGAILTWLRQQAGLDQGKLAQNLGITQASWSRIENGKAVINLDQLVVACTVIGIDFAYIARLYEHICELLESNGIHIVIGLKNSTACSDPSMRTVIKDLIFKHALTVSNKSLNTGAH